MIYTYWRGIVRSYTYGSARVYPLLPHTPSFLFPPFFSCDLSPSLLLVFPKPSPPPLFFPPFRPLSTAPSLFTTSFSHLRPLCLPSLPLYLHTLSEPLLVLFSFSFSLPCACSRFLSSFPTLLLEPSLYSP